ncbi:MAG: glycosyltransferase family 2 protein [Candidatus Binatia bacterium]|nr:glycosyltransferase family 2 protein [Candidatus Binatia bacterium]MDG2011058.1 glycosyltransferase family 2 protein [Candidatus Binatia bacterium]
MFGMILFWLSVGALGYHFIGYPLALVLLGKVRPKPPVRPREDELLPKATLIISAYNEEEVLEQKIENAIGLNYPEGRLEVVVADDGSADRTPEIARSFADRGVVLHRFEPNRGKNLVLNETMPLVTGDVIVFTDANGMYEPDALKELLYPFADPQVGSACGELVYRNFNENPIAEGYNRYWELDQMQKRMEGSLDSLLGANGSIFAVRKDLCRSIPNDVCNDMVQPIWVAASGYACVYQGGALSVEAGSSDTDDELKRRSRIIGRGIRGIAAVWPEIAARRAGLIGWELLSRKGLRYLMPFLFLGIFIGSALAEGWFYNLAFVAQLAVYLAIPIGFRLPDGALKKAISPAVYFGIGNLAALQGWKKVLSGSELGKWQTAERPFETETARESAAKPSSGVEP